jgi:SagB-type dehydrogenase family enzyme
MLAIGIALLFCPTTPTSAQELVANGMIQLPAPRLDGSTSVEQALKRRRSLRTYSADAVTLDQIAQILWAAQGVTWAVEQRPSTWPPEWQWMGGYRTSPSAGALYPLETYLVAGAIEGLDPGLYRYVPQRHALERCAEGDLRETLAEASLRQRSIATAPAVIVITAVYQRAAVKYKERAPRYAHIEVGGVAQSIYLQAEALDLGAVLMGAFRDADVQQVLGLPDDHEPLAIIPVGRRESE